MDKKERLLVDSYATPFVQLILEKDQAGELFPLLEELLQVIDSTKLTDFLRTISVPHNLKARLLQEFLPTGSNLVDNLLQLLIQNQREELLQAILETTIRRLEVETHSFEMTVKSVHPLSTNQLDNLIPLVEKKMGIGVRKVTQVVDSDLIGGFVVTANHRTIDASIRNQLQKVKAKIK